MKLPRNFLFIVIYSFTMVADGDDDDCKIVVNPNAETVVEPQSTDLYKS